MKTVYAHIFIIVGSLLFGACSTDSAGETDIPESTVDAPREAAVEVSEDDFEILLEADLEETRISDTKTVLTVEARVNGVRGRFVVDTTAEQHVLTREFADEHGITVADSTESSEEIASPDRAFGPDAVAARLSFDGDTVEVEEMLTRPRADLFPDLPDVERVGQFAGVLSPQSLSSAANRYTTLDLDENKLLAFEARPNGVKAWLRVRFGAREIATLERVETYSDVLPYVRTTVNGGTETATVLLDSSSDETLLDAGKLGVAEQPTRCLEPGDSGCRLEGVRVDDQTVTIAGVESVTFSAVGATTRFEDSDLDGSLGRDAMDGLVWIFPADSDMPIMVARRIEQDGN